MQMRYSYYNWIFFFFCKVMFQCYLLWFTVLYGIHLLIGINYITIYIAQLIKVEKNNW